MWDTNQTILFYHEDAGVGLEIYAGRALDGLRDGEQGCV